MAIITTFYFFHRLENIGQSSRAATSALAFISSCANPVLYTFAGRSYIKADGLAFMARLFEGTVFNYSARTLETLSGSKTHNLLGLERRHNLRH